MAMYDDQMRFARLVGMNTIPLTTGRDRMVVVSTALHLGAHHTP